MSGKCNLSGVILILCGLLGCTGKDPLQKELLLLHDSTILAATNILERSDLISDGLSKTAIWLFETDLDWDSYMNLVKRNLPSYTATVGGPKQLQLRRQLSGDVFVLDIEGATVGNAQQIRITFHAFPN